MIRINSYRIWALDWPNESHFRGNSELRFFELLIVDRTKTGHCSSLVNDIMCFIAVPGIIFMIIENELTFVSFDHCETYMTFLLKLINTISTIALLGLIIYYHYLNLKLFCVNSCIQHWYIALTPKRLIQIIAEISICLIHPFLSQLSPGNDRHETWSTHLLFVHSTGRGTRLAK